MTHLPRSAGGGPRERSLTLATVVIWGVLAVQLSVGVSDARAASSRECRRQDGTLARYLLCRELAALDSEQPRRYFSMLDRAEGMVLQDLPRRRKPQTGIVVLRRMHAVGTRASVHRRTDLLVDLFDAWERRCRDAMGAGCGFGRADCDVLSILNHGSSERYYGERLARSGFGLVRTAPTHVVTAFASGSRVTSALETTDGSIVSSFRGVFGPEAPRRARENGYLRPMTEDEIIAMHLATIGFRLIDEGLHDRALGHFEEALARNDNEVLALSGRAQALILIITGTRETDTRTTPDCSAFDPTLDGRAVALLADAEGSIRRVLATHHGYPYAHYLLGTVQWLREELPAARRSFRAAARVDDHPAYLCGLGLVELRLGMTQRAIRHLEHGKRLLAALEPGLDATLARRNTDLALALAYKKRARDEWSYRAARKGVAAVERALLAAPAGTCERALRDQLVVLDRRLEPPPGRGLPVRAVLGATRLNADLEAQD